MIEPSVALFPIGIALLVTVNFTAMCAMFFYVCRSGREQRRLRMLFILLAMSAMSIAWAGATASLYR